MCSCVRVFFFRIVVLVCAVASRVPCCTRRSSIMGKWFIYSSVCRGQTEAGEGDGTEKYVGVFLSPRRFSSLFPDDLALFACASINDVVLVLSTIPYSYPSREQQLFCSPRRKNVSSKIDQGRVYSARESARGSHR